MRADFCHKPAVICCILLSVFSATPVPRDSRPAVAAPAAALAHTAEETAAIIGGGCKASWLKRMAREQRIPYVQIGAARCFTDAHITEILRTFEMPALRAAPAAAPAPAAPRRVPASRPVHVPTAGVVQLTARQPRNRGAA
jgi:hypothetical protein